VSLPRGGSSSFVSGKLFFAIVVIVAVLVVFFARGDEFNLPNINGNLSGDMNFSKFGVDSNSNADSLLSVNSDDVSVYFCPQDGCAEKMIEHIDLAKSSIHIAIYSFTHDGIADALIRAKERGVEVSVVFDYDQSKNDASDDERLIMAGVLVRYRNGSGYMHNKFMVIDGNVVATGSFNYSQNADTKNDENLIFIVSEGVAAKYNGNFESLWKVSNAS